MPRKKREPPKDYALTADEENALAGHRLMLFMQYQRTMGDAKALARSRREAPYPWEGGCSFCKAETRTPTEDWGDPPPTKCDECHEAIREQVRAERIAQGLPPTVTDPYALIRVALLVDSQWGRKEGNHGTV